MPLPRPIGQIRINPTAWLVVLLIPLANADSPLLQEPDALAPSTFRPPAPWSEDPLHLPPLPQEADLIELRLAGQNPELRYFVDSRSLRVGKDEVVRYTMVIRSSSGASNLAFEGIRCLARGQYRVFAYGTERGFVPVDQDWQQIGPDSEAYRIELWRHHLCLPQLFKPRSAAEIKDSLSGQVRVRQGNSLLSE